MTTIQQLSAPSHTFMDMKPPLVPRQSTNDVLSFTQIIADRLGPGQTIWDYISPAPSSSPCNPQGTSEPSTSETAALPDATPSGGFRLFGGKRQSVILDSNNLSPLSHQQCADLGGSIATKDGVTPRAQKRKSFVQSFRNSMASLSQLMSSSKPGKQTGMSTVPHYNILVLGSDSAPLAATLYKMSSLLPSTNKIGHYQEVSGFFVAHFRSNGSFSCSPKGSTEMNDMECKRQSGSFRISGDSTKNLRTERLETIDQDHNESSSSRRASRDSDATLDNPSRAGTSNGSDEDDEETLYQKTNGSSSTVDAEVPEVPLSASANASLSVHAFSLDSTWPVPRTLAQTFWFPHAHGIVYLVDATRKNDPRGMDHLLNARELLTSLVADPHFKRKDIPVVVFANKAGLDETCFRVDEVADILGCEDWDMEGRGSPSQRPWCVKSVRCDGEGEGLRESVEWLKSRMSEVWKA
ncbi:MAG: hypothetical protein J3Q66DRAFT_322534 [Benniella sp.]|nr:MAG: hypothetical protein J3Q66DRAFT_322534 [Benniella sp.]